MNAAELLAELQGRGVRLEVADNRLRYRAPKGALTQELRAEMAEHKAALLVLLDQEHRTGNTPARLCANCKAPRRALWPILCDACEDRRLGVAPPRTCPDCGAVVGPHAYRCDACVARRQPPVPWCAAIDCRRPQSGEDQGVCSPEHREQTERDWPW